VVETKFSNPGTTLTSENEIFPADPPLKKTFSPVSGAPYTAAGGLYTSGFGRAGAGVEGGGRGGGGGGGGTPGNSLTTSGGDKCEW
jgi:hypothetical protein